MTQCMTTCVTSYHIIKACPTNQDIKVWLFKDLSCEQFTVSSTGLSSTKVIQISMILSSQNCSNYFFKYLALNVNGIKKRWAKAIYYNRPQISLLTFLIHACTTNSGMRQIYVHTSSSFASKECLWNLIFVHIFLGPIKW